ncbi:hypothetical protein BBP40_008590 [Aspergillus hancockii]|nr:hypothetical protein BBP40_008590 [Aspergillus hancockii]
MESMRINSIKKKGANEKPPPLTIVWSLTPARLRSPRYDGHCSSRIVYARMTNDPRIHFQPRRWISTGELESSGITFDDDDDNNANLLSRSTLILTSFWSSGTLNQSTLAGFLQIYYTVYGGPPPQPQRILGKCEFGILIRCTLNGSLLLTVSTTTSRKLAASPVGKTAKELLTHFGSLVTASRN